jgi:lysozyme family protein
MIEQDFINQCVDDVLAREGGFVDHAADRGGPTNFGITMRALASFRDAVVTRADIGALKRDEAAAIYEKAYARDTGFVDVSPQGDMTERWSVFALLFDSAVNCGPGTVTKWLQRACIELVPKETPIMVDRVGDLSWLAAPPLRALRTDRRERPVAGRFHRRLDEARVRVSRAASLVAPRYRA